jgi:hypothetical protein
LEKRQSTELNTQVPDFVMFKIDCDGHFAGLRVC